VLVIARAVIVVVATFLLTSMGGAAVFGAPITLPLLWFVVRPGGRGWRMAAAIVAGLTVLETGSITAYVISGDGWHVFVAGLLSAAAAFTLFWRQKPA
jgi:hypothetical protein